MYDAGVNILYTSMKVCVIKYLDLIFKGNIPTSTSTENLIFNHMQIYAN